MINLTIEKVESKDDFILSLYKVYYEKSNVIIAEIKKYKSNNKINFIYSLDIPNNFFGKNKRFMEISKRKSLLDAKNSIAKAINKIKNK